MIDGETTILSLSDLDPGFTDSVLADGTVLDSILSFGNATIVTTGATPVPEPATFFAISLGTAACWFRRRKRQA